MSRLRITGLALLLGACATSPTFKDQPVIWRVNDGQNIAEPESNDWNKIRYFSEVLVTAQIERGLELRDKQPARNTNALDEVPNSTWFENRIGARDLTPAEVARGPVTGEPPQLPLTIVRGKDGSGGNPGFFARDATGRGFLIKFDPKENPEMQTASSVIVNRVFWAAGYFVPEDMLVTFTRSDLALDPDAKMRTSTGEKVSLTQAEIDRLLATSPKTADGRYRASASLLLSGTPVGGFTPKGRRHDDPNDLVDHEHRRELRGLKVLAAWVGHTDMKMDNTLDMYVEQHGKRYLRHYLLDFGEALGAHQAEKGRLEDGWEHVWDWGEQGKALAAFGLWKRSWEAQTQTPWPSIGAFSDRWFEPNRWKEAYPFWPFAEADAADLYWGAKLVVRFTRALLEAIVAEGQLSDPEAAKYLVDALLGRRWKIGRDWLDALTPFDDFAVRGEALCGVDLAVRYGIAREGALAQYDVSGRVIDERLVGRDGSVCTPLPRRKYGVLRLRIRRGSELRPELQVHYASEPSPHVIGVIRQSL